MAKSVGSPLTVSVVQLYIPEDWVAKQGKRRYAMVDALTFKVRQLSLRETKSLKLYQRFLQSLSRGLYNQRALFGLRAIDIDQPQRADIAVSVRLEIIVGEGEDSYEQGWAS
jgi:hypothetical protein